MAPPGPAAPSERLLRRIRRRWRAARLIETAGNAAATAGLVALAAFLLFGRVRPAALSAVVAAAVTFAVRIGRLPTTLDAADRLDRFADAHELFGTVARLPRDGEAGGFALLRHAADTRAQTLVPRDVPVWRFRRTGWAARVAAILLPAAAVVFSVAPSDPDARRQTSFVAAGTLLGSRDAGTSNQPAPTSTEGEASAAVTQARPDAASARRPFGDGRADGAGGSASSGAASGGEGGRNGSSAATPSTRRPAAPLTSEPPATSDGPAAADGGAAAESPASGKPAVARLDAIADPTRPTPDRPVSPPQKSAAAAGDLAARVPPAYRDLVRLYFLDRPSD